MRRLILDPESEADAIGFESLRVARQALAGVPPTAWRVVGGWMVRAWVEGGTAEETARPTIDTPPFPGG